MLRTERLSKNTFRVIGPHLTIELTVIRCRDCDTSKPRPAPDAARSKHWMTLEAMEAWVHDGKPCEP
jgi:hypothetical protein